MTPPDSSDLLRLADSMSAAAHRAGEIWSDAGVAAGPSARKALMVWGISQMALAAAARQIPLAAAFDFLAECARANPGTPLAMVAAGSYSRAHTRLDWLDA